MADHDCDRWDPQQYARFRDERSQPFYDLLALVRRPIAHGSGTAQAVDLGCGTGELTRAMFDELRAGAQSQLRMLALDNSPAMLGESAAYATAGLEFNAGAIEAFAYSAGSWGAASAAPAWRERWDLIYSNAALQWIEDHARLFSALCSKLAPGGQLAAQMPCNDDHLAYRLAADLAAEPRFARALGGYIRQTPVQSPEWYASLLYKLGLIRCTVRVQVYSHELAEPALVAQWVKGTLLNNYTRLLDDATAAQFLAAYEKQLPGVLGQSGPYLFTFKRLFIHGMQPG